MRIFNRLDVQLALLFIIMLTATVTLTGWYHAGRLILWHIPVEAQTAAYLNELAPQAEALKKALGATPDGPVARRLLTDLAAQTGQQGHILLLTDDRLNMLAHTGGRMTFIDMVRPDVAADRFVVITSLIRDHSNLVAVYGLVPALSWAGESGGRFHLMAVPDPALQQELHYQPVFLAGIGNHLGEFVWFFLAATLLIIIFIRWRLHPLRQLAEVTGQLNLRQIPDPVAEPRNKDEVGGLVRAFNLATRRLDEDEKMRRQLISDISHELRTPLTGLSGRLEAYQDGLIDDKEALIAFATRKVALLGRIVEDMSLVALADAGELKLDREPVDLKALLADYFGIEAGQQPFGWTIEGDIPPVFLDPWRFRQVLSNLLSNAQRAKPAGLIILVSLGLDEGQAVITFEDNGPGVAPEHLDHLFDRLYRTDKGRHSDAGGSGLGLSIVRSLIEAHGGSIKASPAPSGGLRLSIRIPVAPVDAT